MRKILIILVLLSFLLISCSNSNNEQNVETIKSTLDEDKILRYIKKWDSEVFAISGNLSYLSDLLKVTLEDEIVNSILNEEFNKLEYGSDEYINFLIQWAKENIAHTRMQEEYRNFKGNEPWNGTYKKSLPFEMKKLGNEKMYIWVNVHLFQILLLAY